MTDRECVDLSRRERGAILSICIPTYNRSDFVWSQLQSLCSYLRERGLNGVVEILVADNKSTDKTAEVILGMPHDNIRVVTHPIHYDTAEENIIHSLEYCTGEYVWFLGDDDPVCFFGLNILFEQIADQSADCLVFNSQTISNQGGPLLSQPIKLNSISLDMTVDRMVESVGILYTFAGISNIVLRRSLLSKVRGLEFLSISKIYSHVAWFLDALKISKVRLLNTSIVYYRQNDYSAGHWVQVADRFGVADNHFWTIGLVDLLAKLCDDGVLTRERVGRAVEIDHTGRQYWLVSDIIFKTFQQISTYVESMHVRQRFPDEKLQFLIDFLLSCAPQCHDVLMGIKKLAGIVYSSASSDEGRERSRVLKSAFERNFSLLLVGGPHRWKWVSRGFGFDIYAFPNQFVGVRTGSNRVFDGLGVVDVMPDDETVVVGQTWHEVVAAAAAARPVDDSNPTGAKISPLELVNGALYGEGGAGASPSTEDLIATISALKSSNSWKLTAPLRYIGGLLKTAKN